jgi:ABC-type anion transport system duplicated permease subunit
MPTFYDSHNTRVTFTNTEVEIWIRRLRILYQIDKGRNYGEVIDYIISILQFIPANLLLPLVHITMDTYPTDEIMLNDITRARMYVLEDWAADGDPYRLVNLTESYRTMSPSALITAQQITTDIPTVINNEANSVESSIISVSDYDETNPVVNLNITD